MRDPERVALLREVASEHGTPLTVVLGEVLEERARAFLDAAERAPLDVELFASYKTNPLPASLARLHRLGFGAEVISPYELWLARKLGVTSEHLIVNGPAKRAPFLRAALEAGVRVVHANHLEEIALLESVAAELGVVAPVGVRVAAPCGWGAQLGIALADAPQAFARVRASSHLALTSLHVHRGREISTMDDLDGLLDSVLPVAAAAGVACVDLGGSLAPRRVRHLSLKEKRAAREGRAPRPGEAPLEVADYVARAAARLASETAASSLWLEPGRALFSETQALLTRVVAVRQDHEPPLGICDAGINVAASVAHELHEVRCLSRDGGGETWRLVGPMCTPGDVLVQAWDGPALERGDLLMVEDTGAYVLPFETTFSFPRPGVVWIDDEGARLVRRAENYDDLIARDVLLA